ncbi:barstar family protein [Xanthomonas campestris pv. phormiicola]|nr:barstar family protein [Xanthomonas campestris pv. phormiicola]UYC16592.1 barstar family protein [Xanthomonas campestris pv. phormiicola]
MSPFKFSDIAPSYDAAEVFYVRIDPEICLSEELLKSLYYSLWFPGYFGFNWNALYDFLTDLGWIPCHKIVLVHDALPNLPEKDLKVYLDVLHDSVSGWSGNVEHELEVFFRSMEKTKVENILNG